jgi:hypothetical protein
MNRWLEILRSGADLPLQGSRRSPTERRAEAMAPVPGRTLRCPAKVDTDFAIGSILRLPRVRMAARSFNKRSHPVEMKWQ